MSAGTLTTQALKTTAPLADLELMEGNLAPMAGRDRQPSRSIYGMCSGCVAQIFRVEG
jgi:hypothetical protein